ncbi:MAG: hypothetical protein RLZZ383_671, partial [Pseudomonadota bacterium]
MHRIGTWARWGIGALWAAVSLVGVPSEGWAAPRATPSMV